MKNNCYVRKNLVARRRVLAGCAVLFALLLSIEAMAANIAVFGDRGERNNLTADLQALGHTVTNAVALPVDLSSFDTIWHVGAFTAISSTERNRLRAFVAAGGGLFLTGERPCCEEMNDSHEILINSLISDPDIAVGRQGDSSAPFTFNNGAVGASSLRPTRSRHGGRWRRVE